MELGGGYGLSEMWGYHYAIKKLMLKKPYGLISGPWVGAVFCNMFRKKENVTQPVRVLVAPKPSIDTKKSDVPRK